MSQIVQNSRSFESLPIKYQFVPDQGPGKYRIGLVVLSNDYTTEQDFINLGHSDVAIFVSRVPNSNDCTLDTLPKWRHI